MTSISVEQSPLVVHLRPAVDMTDEQFFEFCRINRDLRIERTTDGDLVIMAPAGGRTGDRNAEITMQLRQWAKRDGQGVAFDSSTGFRLPSASRSRYQAISADTYARWRRCSGMGWIGVTGTGGRWCSGSTR